MVEKNEETECLKEAVTKLYVSGLQLKKLSHSVFVCREATLADVRVELQSAETKVVALKESNDAVEATNEDLQAQVSQLETEMEEKRISMTQVSPKGAEPRNLALKENRFRNLTNWRRTIKQKFSFLAKK